MADKKITIADGHHRYETALDYFNEQGKNVPEAAWILMFLTNLEAEGLAIYPTHRQLEFPENWSRNEFEQRLGDFFEIIPQPKDSSTPDLLNALEKAGEKGTAYCIYFGNGEAALLHLKNPALADSFREEDEPEDLLNLDVYQLHTVILKHILGINTRTPEGQSCIQYKVRADQARQDVDSGKQDLVIFMNATPIEQVREMAEKGIRLPQKATYFYPKLLSGLVINPFES